MEKYYELSEHVIDHFNEIRKGLTFTNDFNFRLIGNRKLKSLIKIQKVSDVYEYLMSGINILVIFNEDIYNILHETQKNILIEQELSKIEIDLNTQKIKIKQASIQTNEKLMQKFGIEAIINANAVVQHIDLKELGSSMDYNTLPNEIIVNENFLRQN